MDVTEEVMTAGEVQMMIHEGVQVALQQTLGFQMEQMRQAFAEMGAQYQQAQMESANAMANQMAAMQAHFQNQLAQAQQAVDTMQRSSYGNPQSAKEWQETMEKTTMELKATMETQMAMERAKHAEMMEAQAASAMEMQKRFEQAAPDAMAMRRQFELQAMELQRRIEESTARAIPERWGETSASASDNPWEMAEAEWRTEGEWSHTPDGKVVRVLPSGQWCDASGEVWESHSNTEG